MDSTSILRASLPALFDTRAVVKENEQLTIDIHTALQAIGENLDENDQAALNQHLSQLKRVNFRGKLRALLAQWRGTKVC
jgi:hypothetical protein